MTITIKIQTANAAFRENGDGEVFRIINDAVERIRRDGFTVNAPLRDSNGNTVGSVKVTGK